jgi:hypothetical protein
MLLAVRNIIQIPHTLTYKGKPLSFNPTCETPDEYAEILLKNQPKIFFKPEGEVSLEGYTMKNVFLNQTVEQIFDSLSPDDKIKVYNFVKDLKTTQKAKEQETVPAVPSVGVDGLAQALKLDTVKPEKSAKKSKREKEE